MIVLGVDPGLGRLGWGVVERSGSRLVHVDCGLIETSPGNLPDRLVQIHGEMLAMIERHRPDALAMERLVFAANRTTALDVAKSIGCVLLAGAHGGLNPVEYAPPEIKKSVTGRGNASKRQVQFMVAKILGMREPPRPDDVADALAVAIAHCLATKTAVP